MLKKTKRTIGLLNRAKLMERIAMGQDVSDMLKSFSAPQLQEVRSFLMDSLIYISQSNDETPLTISKIKEQFEPIPNYYYRQDCREPLEACFNETCMASNPGCFSRKMQGQISVLLKLINQYLQNPEGQNDPSQ